MRDHRLPLWPCGRPCRGRGRARGLPRGVHAHRRTPSRRAIPARACRPVPIRYRPEAAREALSGPEVGPANATRRPGPRRAWASAPTTELMILGDETKDIREPISPELVLIDAELAATARAQLPDFAVRYPSPAPPRVEEAGEVPALVETPEPPSAPLTWADDDEVELDAWERKAPSWRFRAGVAATVAALFALSAFVVLSWRGSAFDPRAAVRQGARPSSPGRGVPPPVPATSTPGTTLPGETSPGSSGTTQPTQTETAEQPPKAPPPHLLRCALLPRRRRLGAPQAMSSA